MHYILLLVVILVLVIWLVLKLNKTSKLDKAKNEQEQLRIAVETAKVVKQNTKIKTKLKGKKDEQ